MKYIGLVFIPLLLFIGCGSSEPIVYSYKTEYKIFNARNVSESMLMKILYNNISDSNQSIAYAKEDSHTLWWYEEDNITLKYSQDKDLHVSFPENPKTEGKKLICAIGNADKTSSPMMILAPETKDIHQGDAYIQVINTINSDADIRVAINNGSALSQYTPFGEISKSFHIEHGSTNSLVGVEYKGGDSFLFDQIDGYSIDFNKDHAYFIIIYENPKDTHKPEIAIIDMTP